MGRAGQHTNKKGISWAEPAALLSLLLCCVADPSRLRHGVRWAVLCHAASYGSVMAQAPSLDRTTLSHPQRMTSKASMQLPLPV
jgi:hypothetical protein